MLDKHKKSLLKNLTYNKYITPVGSLNIMKSLNGFDNFKNFISDSINEILGECYGPIGRWRPNPNKKTWYGMFETDGSWSYLNLFETNYTCHYLVFNWCSEYVYRECKRLNQDSIFIYGEEFRYDEPIVISDDFDSEESETIEKLRRLLLILRHNSKDILMEGHEIYDRIMTTLNMTHGIGGKGEKFYLRRIYDFFDDIVNIESTSGLGDAKDKKTGIDVWTTHSDKRVVKHQVKKTCSVTKTNIGYFTELPINRTSRCDYFVFVCETRILILENNKEKMIKYNDGMMFSLDLKYKEKFYERNTI